jgi:hypothetical protein
LGVIFPASEPEGIATSSRGEQGRHSSAQLSPGAPQRKSRNPKSIHRREDTVLPARLQQANRSACISGTCFLGTNDLRPEYQLRLAAQLATPTPITPTATVDLQKTTTFVRVCGMSPDSVWALQRSQAQSLSSRGQGRGGPLRHEATWDSQQLHGRLRNPCWLTCSLCCRTE